MAITNDIVLIHVDNKPGFYARIDEITPDFKPGWWQVKLLVLTFPLQVFTWILDESQLEGASFTMGGTPLRLAEITSPLELERIEKEKPDEIMLKEVMEENRRMVNKELPKFAQLSSIILVANEFEKTPKRNIKRYLYT